MEIHFWCGLLLGIAFREYVPRIVAWIHEVAV